MSLRLRILEKRTPERLKLEMLDELVRLTADALGCEPPVWSEQPFAVRLEAYARLTAHEAERLLDEEDEAALQVVRARLWLNAAEFGDALRRRLRVRRAVDVLRALTLLYGHIGIDLRADRPNAVEVRRCFFSRFYSEPVCELVSALDEGVAAGLSGGGELQFIERKTGGSACCLARFDLTGVTR